MGWRQTTLHEKLKAVDELAELGVETASIGAGHDLVLQAGREQLAEGIELALDGPSRSIEQPLIGR